MSSRLAGTRPASCDVTSEPRRSSVRGSILQWVAAKIEALLRQADAVDEAEDARLGAEVRGDDLPAELRRREERLAAIREAKARLEAAARAADDARGRQPGQDRNPKGGRPYKRAYGEPDEKAQSNFTDPVDAYQPHHLVADLQQVAGVEEVAAGKPGVAYAFRMGIERAGSAQAARLVAGVVGGRVGHDERSRLQSYHKIRRLLRPTPSINRPYIRHITTETP